MTFLASSPSAARRPPAHPPRRRGGVRARRRVPARRASPVASSRSHGRQEISADRVSAGPSWVSPFSASPRVTAQLTGGTEMDLDPRTSRGLQRYVGLVTEDLGYTGQAFHVQLESPAHANIPLDERMPALAD